MGFFDLAQATYTQLAIPTELTPTLPESTSGMRITIYGATAGALADIRPDLETVEWRLNKPGLAKFKMSYSDTKCTRDILKPGNYVLIEFGNGLPDWAGVIDFPLEQDDLGVIVQAYTGEQLLKWRLSGANWQFQSMAPGAIFESMLDQIHTSYAIGITPNVIYGGGSAYTQAWHYYNLLSRIRELSRLTNEDFYIGHRLTNGRLSFVGNWYQQRGIDKTDTVLLTEGASVLAASLSSQGPVANSVITVGSGSDWSERPIGLAVDIRSIAQYGYREYVEYVSTGDQETLDTVAHSLLTTMSTPRQMISITVVDRSPAYFRDYDIGDIVATNLFVRGGDDWFFDDPVRVIGRSWAPGEGCDLEVVQWDD